MIPSPFLSEYTRYAPWALVRRALAGVAQTVAMKVTGHKTPSMWRRYRITSADEVRDALARTQTAIRAQREQARNVLEVVPGRGRREGREHWTECGQSEGATLGRPFYPLDFMAGSTGLETATSGLTGQESCVPSPHVRDALTRDRATFQACFC